jgi:glutamine synthetase
LVRLVREDGGVDRKDAAERGEEIGAGLAGRGVRAVALTWVDNAGITRVKAVPTGRLGHAAAWGVGMSPVFDVFVVDDSITTSRFAGGPSGDLRLYPDLDRVSVLAAQPGWAWAPVDRLTQEGEAYPGCQRTFARTAAAAAEAQGLELRMAFEIEWFLGDRDATPACTGPAYGMTRVVELSSYVDDLLAALDAQGVPVEQIHPEYAPGQLELSVGATDPVAAADRTVLVRQTIQAVSRAHGHQASFAPVVVAGQVGNGQHLHFSVRHAGQPLFSGGDGRYGLTGPGEALLAGLLDRLPAFTAIGAPSVGSYLRLVPQHWAAPYQCWGRENREAALRLVTGSVGERDRAANAELKCCDGSANPYLVVGAVTAIAGAGFGSDRRLPAEVPDDPALLPPDDQPPRLPQTVAEAVAALRADDVLPDALGEPLLDAFCAVRRAEAELFASASPQEIAEACRWRY